MTVIPYLLPQWQASPDFVAANQVPYFPAPGAVWREGDVLIQQTTGTITAPPGLGLGTLAGVAGPLPPGLGTRITVTQAVTAGAPARTYYMMVTDALTGGNETVPSSEFIVNSPAGSTPIVNVSATGAPATATSYNLYVSTIPGFEAKQTGSIVAYGTGTTLPATLTNSIGVNRAATSPSANIVGIAINDSTQNYFIGGGGSNLVGNQSLLGATNSLPPLTPSEVMNAYVCKLQGGTYWEFSLRQTIPWYQTLVGSAVGLYYDTASGFWVADTAATALGTIVAGVEGVTSLVGGTGDVGKRVIINFSGTGLI